MHHASSIIHHPSFIIHHPSSIIIHHEPSSFIIILHHSSSSKLELAHKVCPKAEVSGAPEITKLSKWIKMVLLYHLGRSWSFKYLPRSQSTTTSVSHDQEINKFEGPRAQEMLWNIGRCRQSETSFSGQLPAVLTPTSERRGTLSCRNCFEKCCELLLAASLL